VVIPISLYFFFEIDPEFNNGLGLGEKTNLQICSMSSLALALAVGFLGIFQIVCAGKNITTVEHHIEELHRKNPFSKGSFKENLAEIFGRDRSSWWLPVDPQLLRDEDLFISKNY